MRFTKAHSLGNDFLIVDTEDSGGLPDVSALSRKICQRHTGVGADGLILVSIKDRSRALAEFRIFNADGSEAEISGNGLRCAAAHYFAGKAISGPRIVFRAATGDRECSLIEIEGQPSRIRVEMGIPRFASEDIPFDDGAPHERLVDYPLSIHGKTYSITAVSIGNPHCGIFFEEFPSRTEWQEIGREVETHPFFPQRTNVEFIRVLSRGEIEVRFWERGVGETMSSGSGSSAAAVAAILKNLAGRKVAVRTAMGSIVVEWEKDRIFQSGPAELVFEGKLL
jgi:diaminopimelate epimerase